MRFNTITRATAVGGAALFGILAAWPASADPPPWARGGWRGQHHRSQAYYYAPPPRPVYYAPAPVVVYHPPPAYYPVYPAYQPYPAYPAYPGYYRSPPISNQDVGGLLGYGIGAVIGRSFDYRR